MKYLWSLSLILLLDFALLQDVAKAQKKNWQKGYFPKGIKKVYFGMPYNEFKNLKSKAKFDEDTSMDFRSVITEEIAGEEFETLIYYFDQDGDKPLYEILVVYPDGVDVKQLARQLYGPPNKEEEWLFEHKKGYPVNIWVYKQKIVLAAILPNTEWDE